MTKHDFLDLDRKTILVTGATSGIGRETAILASRQGARIGLVARREDALQEVAGRLHGDGHITVPYDLTDTEGIPALVRRISDELGGLDGLVHSAGAHGTMPLRTISTAAVRDLFALNVTTAFMLAKGLRHKQVRRPASSIVFLSSAVGLVGQPGVSAYSATKGAIVSMTKSLALELAREGVRVNCVCPGVVKTEMTTGLAETIGQDSFQNIIDAHPLGLGQPEDVANAILFLLSPASRWITGTALSIDGGYTAQ